MSKYTEESESELEFDPTPDMQKATAHVKKEDGLTGSVSINMRIIKESSNTAKFHFYYEGEKITTYKQARDAGIVGITLERLIRIRL